MKEMTSLPMIGHKCRKSANSTYFNHKECRSLVVEKMQQLTMRDLEIFSNWKEKRPTRPHWYNLYNTLIKIDLVERADRFVTCNDKVEEIELEVNVQQLRNPEPHKSLLMAMSDTLLHELQRLIAEPGLRNLVFL